MQKYLVIITDRGFDDFYVRKYPIVYQNNMWICIEHDDGELCTYSNGEIRENDYRIVETDEEIEQLILREKEKRKRIDISRMQMQISDHKNRIEQLKREIVCLETNLTTKMQE